MRSVGHVGILFESRRRAEAERVTDYLGQQLYGYSDYGSEMDLLQYLFIGKLVAVQLNPVLVEAGGDSISQC